MTTLPLPPLVGTRKRAHTLADLLPGDLAGLEVTVDCRELVAATESFADELITVVVVERNAKKMYFKNVGDFDFANWVDARAAAHKVSGRVSVDRGIVDRKAQR
ncbi:hypothetical protein ACFYVR_16140 [Rhodococcus sp. NPDC003318]|uniref:hypothetical protein n=1 Tax=Rhodococcus sp. NPDC003318 TaxID=3364503 RepID=UPI00368494A9